MKPKEKAKELLEKYIDSNDTIETWKDDIAIDKELAKQCALIAVYEIINAFPHSYKIEKEKTKNNEDITIITNIKSNISYWLEVKQEIEKI